MHSDGTFASKLRGELSARKMGARGLAKLLDPGNVEQARKSVRRWLTGKHVPNRASLDSITDALGLERRALDPAEDLDRALMRELRDTRERFDRLERFIGERVAS